VEKKAPAGNVQGSIPGFKNKNCPFAIFESYYRRFLKAIIGDF